MKLRMKCGCGVSMVNTSGFKLIKASAEGDFCPIIPTEAVRLREAYSARAVRFLLWVSSSFTCPIFIFYFSFLLWFTLFVGLSLHFVPIAATPFSNISTFMNYRVFDHQSDDPICAWSDAGKPHEYEHEAHKFITVWYT
jgi:hypothetical protein